MVNLPYKTLSVKGSKYPIYRSQRKRKKYKVKVGARWVHFAAKGYKMFPGTARGDSYCARSSGIKGKDDITSPNFWSRKLWKCQGKRSQ